jgi:hypothetical protein
MSSGDVHQKVRHITVAPIYTYCKDQQVKIVQ